MFRMVQGPFVYLANQKPAHGTMVDPKKDYELLMRYLQGDTQKREPATIPEQSPAHEWKRHSNHMMHRQQQ